MNQDSNGEHKNKIAEQVNRPNVSRDAWYETVETGDPELQISLVVLKKHFSETGVELINQAFEKLKPDIVMIDSIASPEGQLIMELSTTAQIPAVDFSAPPFSPIMLHKVGITPRSFLKSVFGQLLLDSQYNVLELMRRNASALNLNLSVVHSLVAQFNIELLADRDAFIAENAETNARFLRAHTELNWHRLKLLQPKGHVLAVVSESCRDAFYPDFKPIIEYSDQEMAVIDLEISGYFMRLEQKSTAMTSPTREETVLFLHGIIENFDPAAIKNDLISSDQQEERLNQLLGECEKLINENGYLRASRRARVLVELGVQNATELFGPCLRRVYEQFRELKEYPFASLMAEVMREFEIPGAQALIDQCSHDYWESLNRLRGGVEANAKIKRFYVNNGVKEDGPLPTGYT